MLPDLSRKGNSGKTPSNANHGIKQLVKRNHYTIEWQKVFTEKRHRKKDTEKKRQNKEI